MAVNILLLQWDHWGHRTHWWFSVQPERRGTGRSKQSREGQDWTHPVLYISPQNRCKYSFTFVKYFRSLSFLLMKKIRVYTRLLFKSVMDIVVYTSVLQMDNSVIVSDYAQMDRVLREERQYILDIIKKIKKAGCNVLLIQKSVLR